MQLFEEPFVNIKQDWRFCLPLTDQKLAWLDLRDVVDIVVAIVGTFLAFTNPSSKTYTLLTVFCLQDWKSTNSEEHNGRIYYISGPQALTCEEIANIFTTELDMEVRFLSVTHEQIKALIMEATTESHADASNKGRRSFLNYLPCTSFTDAKSSHRQSN